jgi:flagellar biogenesis protein FliO
MDIYNVVSIAFICVVFILIVLFVVSLSVFLRRMLINSSTRNANSVKIEEKLDKIIELLEKGKGS